MSASDLFSDEDPLPMNVTFIERLRPRPRRAPLRDRPDEIGSGSRPAYPQRSLLDRARATYSERGKARL